MLRRLHELDRAILLVLVPVWVACFGLSVRSVLRPAGATSFRVTMWQAAGELPEIVSFAPIVPVEAAGLRVGDRLVRVGAAEMRGASGLEYFCTFLAAAWEQREVPVVIERDGRRIDVLVPSLPLSILRPLVAVTPFFVVAGIVILLRAPRSRVARCTFHLFLVTALAFAGYFSGPGWLPWISVGVFSAACVAIGPLTVRLLLVFPHGVAPQSPWLRMLPWPAAFIGVAQLALIIGYPYASRHAEVIATGMQALGFAGVLVLLLHSYRRSDAVGRRQLKWSVFGLYCAFVPPALAALWLTIRPEDWEGASLSFASLALAPVFVYLALYRYDIFDVDRVLSATATYNVVLVVLAGLGLLLAPRLGDVVSDALAVPAGIGRAGVSGGLALLVVPAQRILRTRLEAVFFRERRALESGLEALCSELAGADDAKALLRRIGERLHDCVRSQSTVIYSRDDGRYAALFVAGRGVAPDLPSDGPLVAALRRQHGPVCMPGELAGAGARHGDPFLRAALEVLNAAVVLPVASAGGEPATFVSLGPKRSGDLYTGTELALLRSVADGAALELQRFDERKFREQSRAMQEAMRRYVPGAVAERIESGDTLEAGEREVTVLFVDIRGYTKLAQGSRAQEIFSTINRYTLAVSEIVRACGGSVVEFNGDGMMAVFGAPAPLAAKERAAVRAAQRIVDEVEGLEHEGRRLSVGVGIATGLDYVGNIQAADRLIWSAIGNTTNLAARLQAQTRELDVPAVIDAATHAALGPERRRFRRHEQMAIRGRSERLDLFALPAQIHAME